MLTTRRSFMRALGVSGAGAAALGSDAFAARGREASIAVAPGAAQPPRAATALRLNSNENPLGPGEKVLAAIRAAFGEANRYPYNMERDLQAAIARVHGVPDDYVTLGCGSGGVSRTPGL